MLISPRYKCNGCGAEVDAEWVIDRWELPIKLMWTQKEGHHNSTGQHYCPTCEEKLDQLRPCPFCGRKAEIIGSLFGDRMPKDIITGEPMRECASVMCTNCKAGSSYFVGNSIEEAKEQAIRAWNRRDSDFTI